MGSSMLLETPGNDNEVVAAEYDDWPLIGPGERSLADMFAD